VRGGRTTGAADSAVGTFPFVTDDMDGQPRTAPYDVGADERASTAVLQRPLTPAVVGPDSP
jgi:hypothetical protein